MIKKNPDVKVTLHTDYHYQYTAGGNDALADGIIGGEDFRTGAWQGYHDVDVNAIVNLSTPTTIHDITINFLSDQSAWIFFPDSAECYVSADGENYTFVGSKDFNNEELDSPKLKTISLTTDRVMIPRLPDLSSTELSKENLNHWIYPRPSDGSL